MSPVWATIERIFDGELRMIATVGEVLALAAGLSISPSRVLDALGRIVEESTGIDAERPGDLEKG